MEQCIMFTDWTYPSQDVNSSPTDPMGLMQFLCKMHRECKMQNFRYRQIQFQNLYRKL